VQGSLKSISERSETFRGISQKELRRKEEQLNYLYQTEKKVNKYRVRLCLLFVLAVIVSLTGLYFTMRDRSKPLPFLA
jgi:hypothetical protein